MQFFFSFTPDLTGKAKVQAEPRTPLISPTYDGSGKQCHCYEYTNEKALIEHGMQRGWTQRLC